MKNLPIGAKLLAGFGLLIVLLLAASIMGIISLNLMNQRLNSIVDVSAEKIKLAARINQGVLAVSRAEKNIILAASREEMDRWAASTEEVLEDMRQRRSALREFSDEEGRELLDAFAKTWDAYINVNRELRAISRKNSNVRARMLSQGNARDAHRRAADVMREIEAEANEKLNRAGDMDALRKNAEKAGLASGINRDLVEIQRGEKNLILARSQQEMDQYAGAIEETRAALDQRLDALVASAAVEEKPLLIVFGGAYDAYIRLHEQVRELSRENANVRAFEISTGEAYALNAEAFRQMAAIVEKNEKDMARDQQTSDRNYTRMWGALLFLMIAGVFAGAGVSLLISTGVSRSMKKSLEIAETMARGELTGGIDAPPGKDEAGMLLLALDETRTSFKRVADQAAAIAMGDNDVDITPRSPDDLLGLSIRKMTRSLRDEIEKNRREAWLKTELNELNEKMLGELGEAALAENILAHLIPRLDARVGALYVAEEEGRGLRFLRGWAFDKPAEFRERVEMGEGLIGQAAIEGKLISVNDLPDHYMRIASAMGDAPPRHVVVAPFLFENKVMGVIELGAFREFSDIRIAWLKSAMEGVAVSFHTARSNKKLKNMLEETRRQAGELQSQAEELESQAEELTQSNEALQNQTTLLEEQKLEIERNAAKIAEKVKELELSGKYKSEFLAN
ncbi:MAG: GAF domain-containing protein, partial [Desulfobacterales bacterium]|nr:GAF domain-containing protein [Desulfobacterales bacterium]